MLMIMEIRSLILLNLFILEYVKIKFNEIFPIDNSDLYPGDYLIDFANNIISLLILDLKLRIIMKVYQ